MGGTATVSWAIPHQLAIKKMPQTFPQTHQAGVFFQMRYSLIPNDWSLCPFGHTSSPTQLSGWPVSSRIHLSLPPLRCCARLFTRILGLKLGSSCMHSTAHTLPATVPPQPPQPSDVRCCWKYIRHTICFSLSSLTFKFSTLFGFYCIFKIIF